MRHRPTCAPFAIALCALILLLTPAPARAQGNLSGCNVSGTRQLSLVQVAQNHYRLTGALDQPVQIDCDEFQLFADAVEHFQDQGRLLANGHVLFVSGTTRISAERVEFNTKSRTGTFYVASGTAMMKEATPAETAGEQEPYAFFWGEELHKVGPSEYTIMRGGFTACVQPTPRWEITSGSLTLKVDDHVMLKNALFKVKGVPLLYLPAFYYPMEEDDRSTGFLMPLYGTATVAGQKISNAFFWAIGRSHDATFTHDWFTRTGHGLGGQYRYQLGGGSAGHARVYRLNEKETTITNGGVETTTPGLKTLNITGDLVQGVGAGMRVRAYADYFSSLAAQQKYQQNVYHATNRTRRYGANLSGSWAEYVLNASFEQRDIFDTNNLLTRDGNLPRVSVSRGQRPIGKSPLYFGVTGDYTTFVRKTIFEDEPAPRTDQGLTRLDVLPTLTVPFTKWPFFTVNSTVSWRGTYWSESIDSTGVQVPDAVGRSFFDFNARLTGPVFHRIWDNPQTGRKVKHVIEPSVAIQRTTAVDDFDRYVKLESSDYILGNVTRLTYGLTNRVYAKRENSREVFSATVAQTYYSDARAAQYDPRYQNFGMAPTKFGAVAVRGHIAATQQIQATFATEWDHQVSAIRTVSAGGSIVHGPWLNAEAQWSLRRFIPELPQFSEAAANHYLNASTTLRTSRNDFGGTFSFNYDLRNAAFLQRRYMAYYNAQCCGVAAELQTWNLSGTATGLTIPQDRRFTISVTLAGIGAVPNFLGGLSGTQNRR